MPPSSFLVKDNIKLPKIFKNAMTIGDILSYLEMLSGIGLSFYTISMEFLT